MKEKKEFDKSLKLIAGSSVIVFIALMFSKVFSYIYRIIIARNYGPEYYGLFSLALMAAGWITVLAIFGLNDGLLRYISIFRGKKENKKINYIFRKSFLLLLITGLIGGTILFFSASYISNNIFNEPELTIFLQLFSLSIPFTTVLVVFLSSLRAYEKIGWRVFLSNILVNFLHVSLILLFIASGFGVIAIPLSYVVGVFIVFVSAVIILKKQVPSIFVRKKHKDKTGIFKEVLSYSWPLIFAEIIWKIFKWTDSFFLGYFETATEVGFYNAAIPIALLLTFSSDLFAQMFVPLINKEYSRNKIEVVRQLSRQVGKWIFFINLPALILLLLFPKEFLALLFGQDYTSAANTLMFLAIGVSFLSFGGISSRILGMLGKSKTVLADVVIVASINIILNIILIPKYGMDGAAISTAISFILLSIIVMVQVYKETKIIPVRRKNINILMAAIISLALLLVLRNFITITNTSLIILSVFFFAFYTLLVLIFKGLDKNDMMIIHSFLGKFKRH